MLVHTVFVIIIVYRASSAMESDLSPKVHMLEISVNKDDETNSAVFEILEHIRPHWKRKSININVSKTVIMDSLIVSK